MKKIGVTSEGEDLDSRISPALGVCPFLFVVEWDNGRITDYKAIPNPSKRQGCTGVPAAQRLEQEGIEALLVGNIGVGSFNYLKKKGIDVYEMVGVTNVEDAVVEYFNNNFSKINAPNSPGKGQGRTQGRGLGRGQGRGLGRGPGRGFGRGGGKGRNRP